MDPTTTTVIITGASRGLGKALALQYIAMGMPLITVARHTSDDLTDAASQQNSPLTQLQADLSDPQAVQVTSEKVAALIPANTSRCILINNAGTLQPVANTARLTDAHAISSSFTLNITAAMLMCSRVVQHAHHNPGMDCRILNISSGAGRGPVPGWGVYCASKAALDLYTQVLAQEHASLRAVSLAPGVIDTQMQNTIRSSDKDDFPQLDRFIQLHQQGQLASPTDTAQRIVQYINQDDFGRTVLDDIRNYS